MEKNKFQQFREQVPAACCQIHLDTPGTGLIPSFVRDAVTGYQEDRYLRGGDSIWRYEDGQTMGTLDMMQRSKAALGKMICAEPENIFFGQNASHIYSVFSSGLPVSEGDNVILPEGGWMSNRFAWQVREADGVEIRYVRPQNGMVLPEDIFNLCDGRTKAVCLPLVEPSTGFMIDAASIGSFCRAHGIWFALDGVQALGVLPVDVEKMNIDFLAGNDYKWMMNFCGTGFGYISPSLRKVLRQRTAGWMSDDERFNTAKVSLSLRQDAGRYELGFPTVSGIFGLGIAAEKYSELGRGDIRDYVFGLQDYLRSKVEAAKDISLLYDFPQENRSAIAVLLFEPGAAVSNEMLRGAKVIASLKPFDGEGRQIMRVGLHYYNNKEDIDGLFEVIGGKGAENA